MADQKFAQKKRLENVKSSRKLIKCGAPQGSNLGPLLFLLYVNDLPNCPDQAKPSMFADDTLRILYSVIIFIVLYNVV
jgi:hypothetical protein